MASDGRITLHQLLKTIQETEDSNELAATITKHLVYDRTDQNVQWPTERIKISEAAVRLDGPADARILGQYDWLCNSIKNGRRKDLQG